jgi:hypothetical protein
MCIYVCAGHLIVQIKRVGQRGGDELKRRNCHPIADGGVEIQVIAAAVAGPLRLHFVQVHLVLQRMNKTQDWIKRSRLIGRRRARTCPSSTGRNSL